jgi:hypothetical protein
MNNDIRPIDPLVNPQTPTPAAVQFQDQNPSSMPPTLPPTATGPSQTITPEFPQQPVTSGGSGKGKKVIVFFIIILLLAAAGVGGYLYLQHKVKTTNPATPTATIAKPVTTPAAKTAVALYVDSTNKKLTETDSKGTVLASNTYAGEYAYFTAATPGGGVLWGLSTTNSVTSAHTFSFIDKAGKPVTLGQPTITALTASNGDRGDYSIAFINETVALEVACTTSAKANDCKVETLDIMTGATKTLVETTAPAATDTGDALIKILGISTDSKTAYIEASGPTSFGKDQDGLYKLDLATAKTSQIEPITYGSGNISLSPDTKIIVYEADSQTAHTGPTFHIVDIATGTEKTAVLNEAEVPYSAGTPNWSPDSSKMLLQGMSSDSKSTTNINYLDVAKASVVSLITIPDSSMNNITAVDWTNNNTVVYEQTVAPSATPNNFTKGVSTLYQMDIATKQAVKVSNTFGLFTRTIWR